MMINFLIFGFFFPRIVFSNSSSNVEDIEFKTERLRSAFNLRNILQNYPAVNSLLVPYKDSGSMPLRVNVSLEVMNFEGINDVEEEIAFTGIFYFRWFDQFLIIENLTDIPYFNLPSSQIWIPTIAQLRDPENLFRLSDYGSKMNAWIDPTTGYVSWYPTGRFPSKCTLNMAKFPFDTQTCDYTLVTWNDDFEYVQLSHDVSDSVVAFSPTAGTDRTETTSSNVWQLTKIQYIFAMSNDTSSKYSTLTYRFTCKRKPLYYMYAVIFPSAMLTVLQLGGVLHPHGPERPNFFMVLLLTFWVLQQVTSQIIPKTSRSCAILTILTIQSTMSIILTLESIFGFRIMERYEEQREKDYREARRNSESASQASSSNQTIQLSGSQRHVYENLADLKRFDWPKAIMICDYVLLSLGILLSIISPIVFYMG